MDDFQGEDPGFDDQVSVLFERIANGMQSKIRTLEKRNLELSQELADKTEMRQYEIRICPQDNISGYTAHRIARNAEITHIVSVRGNGKAQDQVDLEEIQKKAPQTTLVVGLPPGHELQVFEVIHKM